MARKVKNEEASAGNDGLQNPFAEVPVDSLPMDNAAGAAKRLGRVALRLETQTDDKPLIVIGDFAASISRRSLQQLTRKLRDACRCSGAIRQRTIQLHADRLDKVRDVLEHEGFWVSGA